MDPSLPLLRSVRILAPALFIAVAALAGVRTAHATDPVEKIVAVVNDEAISEGDLLARLKLAAAAGNYPDTPEVRERLTPQVLRTLIDDQLRLQEAKRLKINIDKDEVDAGLKQIAEQNNQTLEQFETNLEKQGIPISTLRRQTMAQLAWTKVIQKEIRPRVDMSQEEVDAAYAKMMSSVQKPQYLMAEIFLSVDAPKDDQRVKGVADQLEDQLLHGGNFAKLAQQFSQAAGAASGGDLGWIQEGELPDPLNRAMLKLEPGHISEPIRTQSGYHILLLREKGSMLAGNPAEALVHLKNVLIPFTSQPSKEDLQRLMGDAEKLRASLSSCAAVDEYGRKNGLAGDLEKAGEMVKVADLPRGLAQIVAPLQIDQLSQPVPTETGIMMFMVCARKDPPKRAPPTKEQVANQIFLERLDMQQQRYLSDLRSAAFVDLRV
ncbi:MAG TPA: peptidylprolyl isomerase [Alphaproteobacteria bacterium]|nr:peptidylprolyl isomerase [Alphaproteobacteria bacterium]